MQPFTPPTAAKLTIGSPRLFTASKVLAISMYGVALFCPVLLSILAVSTMRLGVQTLLIPLAILAVATFFLPFGFGNSQVSKLVNSLPTPPLGTTEKWIAQVTLVPRIRAGLRAWIEDADDVGWLYVSDSSVVFQGDSVTFSLPFDQIGSAKLESIGFRGLFLYQRVDLRVRGLPDVRAIDIAERSSLLLSTARREGKRLAQTLKERTNSIGERKG